MGTVTHAFVNAIADDPAAAAAGETLPSHWNAGHVLALVKGDVGLGNVDNTSDANKPVSTATQTALNLKADLASPALTGTPTAPTAAAGTNTTQLATTAFVTAYGRPKLTTNTTYNVPATYATLDAALTAAAQVDFNGFTLTIQLANGTYQPTSSFFTVPVTVGQARAQDLIIRGDPTTPSNVVLSKTGSFSGIVKAGAGARFRITGCQFSGSGNTFGIHVVGGGYCEVSALDFSTGMFSHLVSEGGATTEVVGNYTISSSATSHVLATNGGFHFCVGNTITLTGTPAWVAGYCWADALSFARISGATFSGSATGPRYAAEHNSGIVTDGGGANFLPGDSAGSVSGGGFYT